jgi:hypothetical protein
MPPFGSPMDFWRGTGVDRTEEGPGDGSQERHRTAALYEATRTARRSYRVVNVIAEEAYRSNPGRRWILQKLARPAVSCAMRATIVQRRNRAGDASKREDQGHAMESLPVLLLRWCLSR